MTDLLQETYELKSLISLYKDYTNSTAKDHLELQTMKTEMRLVREQLLKRLVDMRRAVKQLQRETNPR